MKRGKGCGVAATGEIPIVHVPCTLPSSTVSRILVIDDEDAIRRVVRRLLELEGHAITEAASGSEALQVLGQQSFDVILTDVYMPNLDGIELLRQIQKTGQPMPAIVAMSGEFSPNRADMLRTMEALGATDTLAKPFTTEELHATITRAVETSGSRDFPE